MGEKTVCGSRVLLVGACCSRVARFRERAVFRSQVCSWELRQSGLVACSGRQFAGVVS